MPEAGPHNPEYTQHHPNAITDRDKAEFMARASKQQEELIVDRSKVAEMRLDEYADKAGRGFAEREVERARADALLSAGDAAAWRQKADETAATAGELYDRVNQSVDKSKSGLDGSLGESSSQADSPEAPQQ
jgi:hypothetical protein